jgi:hypothetical protein
MIFDLTGTTNCQSKASPASSVQSKVQMPNATASALLNNGSAVSAYVNSNWADVAPAHYCLV